MSSPILYLNKLEFVDNSQIDLAGAGVVVFVGPNNVGKTTSLMELRNYLDQGSLMHNQREKSIFKDVTVSKASESLFHTWLEQHSDPDPPNPITQPKLRRYRNWGGQLMVEPKDIYTRFSAGPPYFSEFVNFLSSFGTQGFLEGEAPDIYQEHPSGSKQFEQFFYDENLQTDLSKLSETAFGVPLSLSRVGKRSVLHFGQIPKISKNPTQDESKILRHFPRANEQGAGVINLITLAQSMSLGNEPVVFLDEPEAHLHPPQAKLAGKYIAERGKRAQVFISTHSIDLLLGLLSVAKVDITIIRLDRKIDNKLKVATLSGSDLNKAWSDPIVRYSRALSGLMHKGVVICESDGDCLYYEAVLDHLRSLDEEPAHDLLFIQGGGKAGVKRVLPALRKLSVPVCVVTDFDMLKSWDELKSLYRELGGDPKDIQADWTEVNNHLTSIGETRKNSDIQDSFGDIAKNYSPSAVFNKSYSNDIKAIIKINNGWSNAKNQGINSMAGSPHLAAKRILEKASEYGLLICPTGELESFHRDAPAGLHGPAWVTHVISQSLYKQLEQSAIKFIRSIPTKCVRRS